MDCGVCSNPFDEAQRRPKLLSPCGHTFCLHCLQAMEESAQDRIKCPSCKQQVSQRAPILFNDNFSLLSVVKSRHQAPENKDIMCRNWCVTCSSEASPGCESWGHDTRGLLGFRRRQVEAQLEGLRRREAALRCEWEAQRDLLAALQPSAERTSQQLQAVQDCAAGLWEGREPWDKQLERAAELLLQGTGDLSKLNLLSGCETVDITSNTWRMEGVELRKQPALCISLQLLLQQRGGEQLQPVQQQQQQQEEEEGIQEEEEDQVPANLEEMDLKTYFLSGPDKHREEKVALLQRDVKIRALQGVSWSHDPRWVRLLLFRHLRTLEELDVSLDFAAPCNPLADLACLPELRKLVVRNCTNGLAVPQQWRGQLQSLYWHNNRMDWMGEEVLKAHRNSLQKVLFEEVSLSHLNELQRMPALRELHLTYFGDDLTNDSVHLGPWQGKLKLLTLGEGLRVPPQATIVSLLKSHRNSLEQVKLVCVTRDLLLELQLMPALRVLIVSLLDDCLWEGPVLPTRWQGQLQFLQIRGSPRRATVLSLLKAVGSSLQELRLEVGLPLLPGGDDEDWPGTRDALPALLQQCDLRQLRFLELTRSSYCLERHETPCGIKCKDQVNALRAVLPGCAVKCSRGPADKKNTV